MCPDKYSSVKGFASIVCEDSGCTTALCCEKDGERPCAPTKIIALWVVQGVGYVKPSGAGILGGSTRAENSCTSNAYTWHTTAAPVKTSVVPGDILLVRLFGHSGEEKVLYCILPYKNSLYAEKAAFGRR